MSEHSNMDWVTDLLRKLPVPKPIPEDISKQLDKFRSMLTNQDGNGKIYIQLQLWEDSNG